MTSAAYASWPYRALLEERIARAEANAASFDDADAENDFKVSIEDGNFCVLCHATKLRRVSTVAGQGVKTVLNWTCQLLLRNPAAPAFDGWVTDEDAAEIAARKTKEQGFHPPLDIVDGAARIVDPIFAGFNSGKHVWGAFLKDYAPTDW